MTSDKPCCKRIDATGITYRNGTERISIHATTMSWCILDDGHIGPCSGVSMHPLPPTDFGPAAAQRRRG